jgi:hypothetical protein
MDARRYSEKQAVEEVEGKRDNHVDDALDKKTTRAILWKLDTRSVGLMYTAKHTGALANHLSGFFPF